MTGIQFRYPITKLLKKHVLFQSMTITAWPVDLGQDENKTQLYDFITWYRNESFTGIQFRYPITKLLKKHVLFQSMTPSNRRAKPPD